MICSGVYVQISEAIYALLSISCVGARGQQRLELSINRPRLEASFGHLAHNHRSFSSARTNPGGCSAGAYQPLQAVRYFEDVADAGVGKSMNDYSQALIRKGRTGKA